MKIKAISPQTRLIVLCWLVYTSSYLGKLSYTANISRIGDAFGVSYSEAGLVSTFFFFAYGIGQIVNGILCKKFNIKYTAAMALLICALMNVCVAITPSFTLIKYLWLINGAFVSTLWPLVIRLLADTLDGKDIGRATVTMGTTVAVGTFIIYGVSALFSAFFTYRATFVFSAVALLLSAVSWLVGYDGLVGPLTSIRVKDCVSLKEEKEEKEMPVRTDRSVMLLIAVLAVFAVSVNFVKDGLTSWTPDILEALYSTPPWLSILLTLLLPAVSVLGVTVATWIHNKLRSFILSCTVLFVTSSMLVGAVILLLGTGAVPVTVGCFAVISCLMAGINNVILSIMPLEMRGRLNSGRVSGILNGFCYLGSTVSAYGLGLVADGFGWKTVFYVFLAVCISVSVFGLIISISEKLSAKEKLLKEDT